MTKNEFIGLLNTNMLTSIRQRDCVDCSLHPVEYGYYNGQFRAFELVIGMLGMVDVCSIDSSDLRNFMNV